MRTFRSLLVTGGRGFIGSAFIRYVLKKSSFTGTIFNVDQLTYAAQKRDPFEGHERYRFIKGDICDVKRMEELLSQVDGVVHFAAETHVDRSIDSAAPFIQSNIVGTHSLLEALRKVPRVHFHHISTDEVYGSLKEEGLFSEMSPYHPNSPYAASKAASDHLVRAYAHTYGLDVTLSHCSNNYGPAQHPEKLIPKVIQNCMEKRAIPIYGDGKQIRDWLYVDDHVEGIWKILTEGKRGETYDMGGSTEISNLEMAHLIAQKMSACLGWECTGLIEHVADRKGHDFGYAMDSHKMRTQLSWKPQVSLDQGLEKTIAFYLDGFLPFPFKE